MVTTGVTSPQPSPPSVTTPQPSPLSATFVRSQTTIKSAQLAPSQTTEATQSIPRPLSRAERINFKAIYDEEAFHAELASINWATVFDMENVAAAFATTVCDAVTQVNAPLFTGRRPQGRSS